MDGVGTGEGAGAGAGAGRAAGVGEVQLRPMADGELPAVMALLAETLGWSPDGDHERFFRWKHLENPFGTSPAWVADADGRVVGLRVMLRWRFWLDGEEVTAVRAVDTATHPDFQGRGLFRSLTLQAVQDLRAAGVGWVFNTPNDKSRPGYLKMGWSQVGRLPIAARVASPAAALRVARARVPAEKWSTDTSAGEPATDVLASTTDEEIESLLAPRRSAGLRTAHTAATLRWRYGGFPDLRYRVVLAGSTVADGLAIFRVRRRGAAQEAAVVEVLAPDDDPRVRRELMGTAARVAGADHAVVLAADRPGIRTGYLPLPGQGPILTSRSLADERAPQDPARWQLSLGDVELF